MKPIWFLGDTRERLRAFPKAVREAAGHQLERVQWGERPDDWKPMPGVGAGVEELRVREASGAYRVIYLARRPEAVYVLHAFAKKSLATAQRDLDLARKRLQELKGARR